MYAIPSATLFFASLSITLFCLGMKEELQSGTLVQKCTKNKNIVGLMHIWWMKRNILVAHLQVPQGYLPEISARCIFHYDSHHVAAHTELPGTYVKFPERTSVRTSQERSCDIFGPI